MNLRVSIALLVAFVLVSPHASASTVVITQSGKGFTPAHITINLGDTVRWQWTSGGHTVTEGVSGQTGQLAFHSNLNSFTPSLEVLFDAAFLAAYPRACGSYEYFCEIHPLMRGSVTVSSSQPGNGFCFGDGSLGVACPCVPPSFTPSPSGAPQHGCANAFAASGAILCASGTTSPDTIAFVANVGAFYSGFGFLIKGNAQSTSGIASGDGVRCASGQLIRFGGHNAGTFGASDGTWTYPNTAQTISVSSATLQPSGQQAFYQLFYRHTFPDFCNPSTTNISNGYVLVWP